MTTLLDGAGKEAGLASTRTEFQNTRSGNNAERLADHATKRADKTAKPTGAPKIGGARRVIRKQLLKFGQRLGESRIVALVDVHNRHDGRH